MLLSSMSLTPLLKNRRDSRKTVLVEQFHHLVRMARLASQIDMRRQHTVEALLKERLILFPEMSHGTQVPPAENVAILTDRDLLNLGQSRGYVLGRALPAQLILRFH